MTVLSSQANPRSSQFQKNMTEMNELIQGLEKNLKDSLNEGSEKYVERHQKEGKLSARERVERILDQDSPFLELMPLAGIGQKEMSLGGSVVGGIGLVSGVPCMIHANVPTIKGGALNQISLLKGQRLDIISRENRLPTIYLTESAGADLP